MLWFITIIISIDDFLTDICLIVKQLALILNLWGQISTLLNANTAFNKYYCNLKIYNLDCYKITVYKDCCLQ